MTDVTGGTPPTGASEFDVPADIKAVYDHFGDAEMFAVANAAALPASGNWDGRHLLTQDTGTIYVWWSSAWHRTSRAPFARVAKNTAQSTSTVDGTLTEVLWTSDASTDGLWTASGGAAARLRLNRLGVWRVSASLRAASTIYARVGLNGASIASNEQSGTYVPVEDLLVCTNPTTDYASIHIMKSTSNATAVALVEAFCSARAVFLG